MKKLFLITSLCLCSLFISTTQVFAKEQNYVVAAFKVNGSDQYQYLENSFASMLASRLFVKGEYETASTQDTIIKSSAPTNKSEASALLNKSKADFIFYGSITIMGSQASIDIISLDKAGKQVQEASTSSVDSLITSIQTIADKLKISVFLLNPSSGQDFVLTETGRTSMFVQQDNSQKEDRLRSQILDFAALSMDVGDFTGNGNRDIVFGDNVRSVHLYEWNNGAMKPLAEYRIPSSQRILLVRTIKQEGKDLILLSTFADGQLRATGSVLEFDGKKLVPYMKKTTMPFFVNTLVSPETGETTIIGQALSNNDVFRGDIFEINISKDGYTKGESYNKLPRNVNLFNFMYLPDKKTNTTNLITLTSLENIQVTSPQYGNIYQTDEHFSGGNAFLRTANGALVSSASDDVVNYFYIPMRMVALDMYDNQDYQLLVNYPISTRAKIFSNYRTYPEGEVQALYWNGVNLDLAWKTELIKGTIADFQVDDIDNNDIYDLVTCMVTYPGALGFGDKKTVITIYPLDKIGQ